MKQVRNHHNHMDFPKDREHNYAPSLTVPGDALSLKELLERNARGLPLTGNGRESIYHGEDYIPDLRKMDLSEIHDLATANQQEIKSYHDLQKRAALAEAAAKERKLQALQKEIDEYRSRLPQIAPTGIPPQDK